MQKIDWKESCCYNCRVSCCSGEPIHLLREDWERIEKYQLKKPEIFQTKYHVLMLNQCAFQQEDGSCSIQQIKPYLCYRYPYITTIEQNGIQFSLTTECPNWEKFATLEHFYRAVVGEFFMMGYTASQIGTDPFKRMDHLADFQCLTENMQKNLKKKPPYKLIPICLFRNTQLVISIAKSLYHTKIHPSSIPEGYKKKIYDLYIHSLYSGCFLLH